MTDEPNYLDYDELLDYLETQTQLAERLGVSATTLNNWIRRENAAFPKEKVRIGRYPLYDYREVEAWFRLWRKVTASYIGNANGNENMNGGSNYNGKGKHS